MNILDQDAGAAQVALFVSPRVLLDVADLPPCFCESSFASRIPPVHVLAPKQQGIRHVLPLARAI